MTDTTVAKKSEPQIAAVREGPPGRALASKITTEDLAEELMKRAESGGAARVRSRQGRNRYPAAGDHRGGLGSACGHV